MVLRDFSPLLLFVLYYKIRPVVFVNVWNRWFNIIWSCSLVCYRFLQEHWLTEWAARFIACILPQSKEQYTSFRLCDKSPLMQPLPKWWEKMLKQNSLKVIKVQFRPCVKISAGVIFCAFLTTNSPTWKWPALMDFFPISPKYYK